ncbi:MAG: hypothetical protein ACJAYU_000766 [Bradymonadia bacterium]|jgi:hypothetical protein
MSIRPFLLAALCVLSACSGLDEQRYDVLTQGTVMSAHGPVAPGPTLRSGEGLAEFAFSDGLVPYESQAATEPATQTVASTQFHFRFGVSTGGIGDFSVIGTVAPLALAKAMNARLQQPDVGQDGALGALTLVQRFDFVPDPRISAGISVGSGARSAAFVRTIDGVSNQGRRATWFFHGGLYGGAEVNGPLWLGGSLNIENLLTPTGLQTVYFTSAANANRYTRRFRHVAVFTPSLDMELRFGTLALQGSVYSSIPTDIQVAALPIGGRFGMRFYFGGTDEALPMPMPFGPVVAE